MLVPLPVATYIIATKVSTRALWIWLAPAPLFFALVRYDIWFFLTYYAKSIAKAVKLIEQICQNVNGVFVMLDI